jgi:broad-specificity NMP kinase
MRFLVTGPPGSGKSAVAAELTRRGLYALDTDEIPDLTGWDDRLTGRPAIGIEHPIDLKRYAWNWRTPALLELLRPDDRDVFVCAVTSNMEYLLHLFDRVFALQVEASDLVERLRRRTNNLYGKHPNELASVLEQYEQSQAFWRAYGATMINASRPVADVVDAILAAPSGD